MFSSNAVKYIFYVLVALAVICSYLGVYFLASRPAPVAQSTSTTRTYQTTIPVKTVIIREQIPARIDTVVVDGHAYDIASYNDTLKKDKTTIGLRVRYNEYSNLFDVNADVSTVRDSVYSEKNTITVIEKKQKLIGLTGGISTGFSKSGSSVALKNAGIDAGIKILGRYSATAFANTDNVFGIRLGVDF